MCLLVWVKKKLPESEDQPLPKNLDGIAVDVREAHLTLMKLARELKQLHDDSDTSGRKGIRNSEEGGGVSTKKYTTKQQ